MSDVDIIRLPGAEPTTNPSTGTDDETLAEIVAQRTGELLLRLRDRLSEIVAQRTGELLPRLRIACPSRSVRSWCGCVAENAEQAMELMARLASADAVRHPGAGPG